MRGCLGPILGFIIGAGLMLYWWPHAPHGTSLAGAGDLHVTISDTYLARTVQRRLNTVTLPSVTGVRIASSPPGELVLTATVAAGPISTPATIGIAPQSSGGQIRIGILSTSIAGISLPPQLLGFITGTIDGDINASLPSNIHITGMRVVPAGIEVSANAAS